MKVRIELTVEIDPEAWTVNYGVEGDRAIRDDVRAYARSLVIEQFRETGVLGGVR